MLVEVANELRRKSVKAVSVNVIEKHGLPDRFTGFLPYNFDGGVRTDEAKQLGFFNAGTSKARTLAEPPHGRADAIDVAPYSETKRGPDWSSNAPFHVIGAFAKRLGLQWGGDSERFMVSKGHAHEAEPAQ